MALGFERTAALCHIKIKFLCTDYHMAMDKRIKMED
jgi:hypothetical protein